MNSGFSNVARTKDTTKLKSFLLAVLIQMAIAPQVFIFLGSSLVGYLTRKQKNNWNC